MESAREVLFVLCPAVGKGINHLRSGVSSTSPAIACDGPDKGRLALMSTVGLLFVTVLSRALGMREVDW